jgi:hypothetical protein
VFGLFGEEAARRLCSGEPWIDKTNTTDPKQSRDFGAATKSWLDLGSLLGICSSRARMLPLNLRFRQGINPAREDYDEGF